MLQAVTFSPAIDPTLPAGMPAMADDSPAQLRAQAAQLVAMGSVSEARQLIEEGLSKLPRSEDLLAMHALLCEMQHDWRGADRDLEKLLILQGLRSSPEAWAHWVRVLRCQNHAERALKAAQRGLQLHPDDPMLQSERDTLQAMLQATTRG